MASTTVLDAEFHVGDVGSQLVVVVVDQDDVVVDISGATQKTIYITKPDGTVLTKTASFDTDGTDGALLYSTLAGDFSVKGTYRIQGYVAGAGVFTGSTRESTFLVLASRHG